MPHNNWFPPLMTAALAFALTLCAAACALSAQPGAASQPSVPCATASRHEPAMTATLKWTPDGSRVLFGKDYRLYTVAVDGSTLYAPVRSPPPQRYTYEHPAYHNAGGTHIGLSADISPDGSRIVYTTCEYITEPKPWHHKYVDDPFLINYELATSKIDGSDKGRLTENLAIDHYLTWSPDGSRIAFVSNVRRTESEEYLRYVFRGIDAKGHEGVAALYTIGPDGTGLKVLTPAFYDNAPRGGAVLLPPRWSPDGERVAFIGRSIWDRPDLSAPYTLYTATTDGLNLRTIAGAAGAPSWSPDGQRLAFVANIETASGYRLILRSASADGGDVQDVAEIEEIINGGNMFGGVLRSGGGVSWSTDGSAFIVSVANEYGFIKAFVIGDDGSELQSFSFSHAEWSPDGSRIAVVGWTGMPYYGGVRGLGDVFLFVVSPDGSDRRDLVMIDDDRELRAANRR